MTSDTPNKMSRENSRKALSSDSQAEQMLQNAVTMTEMAIEFKERCNSGEKYASYLRNLAIRANKTLSTMQQTGRSFLYLAHRLAVSSLKILEDAPVTEQTTCAIKLEFEKLITILDKEVKKMEEVDSVENTPVNPVSMKQISEKIHNLEIRHIGSDSYLPATSGSNKSVKYEVDERYPEKWSRESLIDINNVSLPPVPEDIFTTFSKTPRSSSMSSLKSIRKVKLCLHRAESISDEDEDSDTDTKHLSGDGDRQSYLMNIEEEK